MQATRTDVGDEARGGGERNGKTDVRFLRVQTELVVFAVAVDGHAALTRFLPTRLRDHLLALQRHRILQRFRRSETSCILKSSTKRSRHE